MPKIYLEEAPTGRAMAFAPDIPGTYGWGPSRQAALEVLQEDIHWKSRWLKDHGLNLEFAEKLELVESVPAEGTASDYDTEGFFSWDAQPYSNQELSQVKQIISWSRADLLSLLDSLPRPFWEARFQQGKRTVAETVDHIAIAEWWYTSRVPNPNPLKESWRDYPAEPLDKLLAVRADVLSYLGGMSAIQEPQRTRQVVVNGETWTGRKILRRMVWHELHHYKILLGQKGTGLLCPTPKNQ